MEFDDILELMKDQKIIHEIQISGHDLGTVVKLFHIARSFQLLLYYGEKLNHNQLVEDMKIEVVYEYHSYSEDFGYFADLVETLFEKEECFTSAGNLVNLINELPMSKINTALTHLVTVYVQLSGDEIYFFYRVVLDKVLYMRSIFHPFEKLLIDTMNISEIIAARFLGNLSGPGTEEIANNIDDVQFLLEFLHDQNKRKSDRKSVLLSIIYRQLLPLEDVIQLIVSYHSLIMNEDTKDLDNEKAIIFLLDQSLSISLQAFKDNYQNLSRYFNIDPNTTADIVLQHGKGTELVDNFNDEEELFETIFEIVKTTMEPAAEEIDRDQDNYYMSN